MSDVIGKSSVLIGLSNIIGTGDVVIDMIDVIGMSDVSIGMSDFIIDKNDVTFGLNVLSLVWL